MLFRLCIPRSQVFSYSALVVSILAIHLVSCTSTGDTALVDTQQVFLVRPTQSDVHLKPSMHICKIADMRISFQKPHSTEFTVNYRESLQQSNWSHFQTVLAVDTSLDGVSDFFVYRLRSSNQIFIIDNNFKILQEYTSEEQSSQSTLLITLPINLSQRPFDVVAYIEYASGEQTYQQSVNGRVNVFPVDDYIFGEYTPGTVESRQYSDLTIADLQYSQEQTTDQQRGLQQIIRGRKAFFCPPRGYRNNPDACKTMPSILPGDSERRGVRYDIFKHGERGYDFWCSCWPSNGGTHWEFNSRVFSEKNNGYIGRCPFRQGRNSIQVVWAPYEKDKPLGTLIHSIDDEGDNDDEDGYDRMIYKYDYTDDLLSATHIKFYDGRKRKVKNLTPMRPSLKPGDVVLPLPKYLFQDTPALSY